MTPKEKAKQLVSKFNFEHTGDSYTIFQNVDESKRCAIIAVDEIIQAMDNVMLPNPFKQYWNKVKQEIQAL
jgi:hypothetical protein